LEDKLTDALAPQKVLEGQIVDADHAAIQIKMGAQLVNVPIPTKHEDWTPLQRAVILQSTPQWSSYPVPYLMFVDTWARQRGLDVFGGNVYIIEGKPSTSDEAKINNLTRALRDKIEYLTVSDITKATNPISGQPDLYAEAVLKLKDETKERRYKAWLSEWRNPKNANWTKNPTDSLQRKAMARIAHFAAPMGTESEDFIPTIEGDSLRSQVSKALSSAPPLVETVGQPNTKEESK